MCRDESDDTLKWMQDHECKESEDRGMQEVTFEVETITPLFLAGADQATAESYSFFILYSEVATTRFLH